MLDKETIKKLLKVTEKDIETLSNKASLTPDEHRSLKSALINKAMLEEECNKMMYDEKGMSGYPYSYAAQEHPAMAYEEGYSGRRMPRMNTSYGMNNGSYGMYRGYSGHSIQDRMIACLEKMMDETDSEYERQTVARYIEKLKQ